MNIFDLIRLEGLKNPEGDVIHITTSSIEPDGQDFGIDRTYLYTVNEINGKVKFSMEIIDIKEEEIEELKLLGFDLSKEVDRYCKLCKEKISEVNTYSSQGWKEISISGICEKCFDDLFKKRIKKC